MFKRKLLALDHHNPHEFHIDDETEFRNLIVWIEDQKIRHYRIEDREAIRNTSSAEWPKALNQFLSDLKSPIPASDKSALVDWLLGYAIRLEYGDEVEKYKNVTSPNIKQGSQAKSQSANPLDCLDFEAPDFKAGVTSLASMLQIPPHADRGVVLKAICLLVKEKLSKAVVEKVQKEGVKPAKTITLEEVILGFETSDYITAEAAKILRLLHIRDLRVLQNSVNEATVTVQALTANPKTDTKLGKVGKG